MPALTSPTVPRLTMYMPDGSSPEDPPVTYHPCARCAPERVRVRGSILRIYGPNIPVVMKGDVPASCTDG